MTFPLAQEGVAALLLATLRITAWLTVAPPFASSGWPRTVKVMLGVVLAAVVSPGLPRGTAATTDTATFLTSAVLQVAVGLALGFGVKLVFAAVESAGALLDLFGGFSLSFAFDPLGTTSSSVFSRFYMLMATVLTLVTPAHQYLVLGFLRSFAAVPLDGGLSTASMGRELTHALTGMFVSALQIAGPMIVVLFLADVALGLLNRIAPQLNAFSLSFPLKIGLTLGLVGFTFTLLPGVVAGLGEQALRLMTLVTG